MVANSITSVETVGQQLDRFYREHDLGADGGVNQRWAKVKMGWFNFYIPNTASRKRALVFHDVHHMATGYKTDLRSEAEIGAWEIASGCRNFWAAWVLNYTGFVLGLVISPARTFKAFIWGRQCKNLYHGLIDKTQVKESSIEEIRTLLGLNDRTKAPTLAGVLHFLACCLPAAVLIAAPMIGLILWLS